MSYDFGKFEEQVEEQEQEVEVLENEKMECEERLSHVQQALQTLEQDNVVIAAIEKTEAALVKDNEKLAEKMESRRGIILDLEAAIANEIREYENEREIIEQLSEAGADVSEAWSIIEERGRCISECTERLRSLAERLGVSLTEIGDESGGTYGSKHLVKTYSEGSVKKSR